MLEVLFLSEKIRDVNKVFSVLEREEKRFKDYGCVKIEDVFGTSKRFHLLDKITWYRITRHFKFIAPMVKALAKRDTYTAEHSERVALMTYRCCMLMNMSSAYRKTITLSAFCHDVGKMSIPDGILNKPGRLTDEEFKEIKEHSADGAELLQNQTGHLHISDGAMYHHERWDGNGYPTGASGENIPFLARIIAIADSIDAMMSDRPYRRALTNSRCREEIEKNSGIMYDPRLASLVLENWSYITDGIYTEENSAAV